MIYYFLCDCGNQLETMASIKVGPPKLVMCTKCGQPMYQDFGTGQNFILKGEWPGKTIKNTNIRERDKDEFFLDETTKAQKEANEILKERRKGKQSFAEFTKHNHKKVERYRENIKQGIKGK